MSESGWWQRHGAVFTSIITLISVLTYLHVSLSAIRDEMRTEMGSFRTEIKAEIKVLRAETGSLRTEMGKLRTEIRGELRDFRAALDRVETKVDEVRGFLRLNASAPQDGPRPKE